ncbi:MAG: hypothetical protein DCC67_02540 [Planctomycetota bacterium]|nr:MAG: hypothetical protein DCC67_02540 [Planctomycetota bacterium]
MFLAHSIRLRDPWLCEPTAEGGLRWTRAFHRPTGLEPDDDLWLVVSGLPAEAEVRVNGHAFATDGGRESFATGEPFGSDAVQSQGPADFFRTDIVRGASGSDRRYAAGAEDGPARSTVGQAGAEVTPASAFALPPSAAKLPARYNLTSVLADRNVIEITLPRGAFRDATGSSPLATPPVFPYDARLAIMART